MEKNNKINSSKFNKINDEIIRDLSELNKTYNENILNKNKDILLQVRINEEYNQKLTFLETILEKNRSEIIRKAIDLLFENSKLENEKRKEKAIEVRKRLKKERTQEEIIIIVNFLLDVYKSADMKEYLEILDTKLKTLEELKK